jgi:hypothetical protein
MSITQKSTPIIDFSGMVQPVAEQHSNALSSMKLSKSSPEAAARQVYVCIGNVCKLIPEDKINEKYKEDEKLMEQQPVEFLRDVSRKYRGDLNRVARHARRRGQGKVVNAVIHAQYESQTAEFAVKISPYLAATLLSEGNMAKREEILRSMGVQVHRRWQRFNLEFAKEMSELTGKLSSEVLATVGFTPSQIAAFIQSNFRAAAAQIVAQNAKLSKELAEVERKVDEYSKMVGDGKIDEKEAKQRIQNSKEYKEVDGELAPKGKRELEKIIDEVLAFSAKIQFSQSS